MADRGNCESVKRPLFDAVPAPAGKKLEKYSISSWYNWTTEEVCKYLRDSNVDEDVVSNMMVECVTGRALKLVDEARMAGWGIEPSGKRLDALSCINDLINPKVNMINRLDYKVFNDSIHGPIEMHPLLVAVIDTPEFQRLRWVKQLGISYLVYPGASHNRFEHSLGVAHLAGEFASILRRNQPELGITDEDVLCVELAGLCHDLGHGPFSHIFDNKFMPAVGVKKWKHEDASIQMFDHLIQKNRLQCKLNKYNIGDQDLMFVKEMIRGPLGTNKEYVGRSRDKHFLYEIVANKRTEVDVDKWDYFARDCHHLGVNHTFDHKRFIHFSRVITHEGTPIICCRDKEVKNLYDMFQSRANLHRMAYKHKTNQNVENMLVRGMILADEFYRVKGSDGKLYKMSEAKNDMEAYSKLTDSIFIEILNSCDDRMKPAQELFTKILQRKLFKFLGETKPRKPSETSLTAGQVRDAIASKCKAVNNSLNWKDELIVQDVSVDFSMGVENPIDMMRFYSKKNPNKAIQKRTDDVSTMLPNSFAENRFRLYCRTEDPQLQDVAKKSFEDWCDAVQHDITEHESLIGIKFTPAKSAEIPVQESPDVAKRNRDSLALVAPPQFD